MVNIILQMAISLVLVLPLMGALWAYYMVKGKANIVDVGWGIAFMVCMAVAFGVGQGVITKKIVMALMVFLWSFRLTHLVWKRYTNEEEDPRYTALRAKWGGDYQGIKFLMMFLFQGIVAVVLSLPFFIVSADIDPRWTISEGFGFCLWLIGLLGAALADSQLQTFREDPKNAGKVLDEGLWSCSRHPNYFFEWVVWIGYFTFAWGSPWGSLALISPLLMYYLLVHLSGIPPLEAHEVATKGDAYKEYQQKTSSFFFWFC